MRLTLAILLALPLPLTSCVHTSGPAPSRAGSEAVRALLMAQQAAWNRGDIEGFMEGYWKSDRLVFTSGGNVRRGWQETLDRYRKSYSPETMGRLSFDGLELESVGPNVVVVLGRWSLAGLSEPVGGVFTLVVRRFDEGWRVVHDHTSSFEK